MGPLLYFCKIALLLILGSVISIPLAFIGAWILVYLMLDPVVGIPMMALYVIVIVAAGATAIKYLSK